MQLMTYGSSGVACGPTGQSCVGTSGSSPAMLRVAAVESPAWACSVITHSLLACIGTQIVTLPADLAPSSHGNTLQVSVRRTPQML